MVEADRERIFAEARDVLLAALPRALALYVYGSFARGDEWPQSDLDLAVLLPADQDIPDLLGLIGEISTHTGRDVDLVDLRKAGDVLRREVLEAGRVLHTADPDSVLAWEASAMSRYARHREEVREILEDFERTGTGFAR